MLAVGPFMCRTICRVQTNEIDHHAIPIEAITSNYLLDPNSEFCLLSLHLNQRWNGAQNEKTRLFMTGNLNQA